MVRTGKQRGFTLIEMVIVIAIMVILISIAVPMYQRSIVRSREAVLRDDLFTLRTTIDQYTMDKAKAPQSLEDLVSAGYLRAIPKDPITNSADTWVTVNEDVMLSVDQSEPGITDVHSGSDALSTEGTPYSSW